MDIAKPKLSKEEQEQHSKRKEMTPQMMETQSKAGTCATKIQAAVIQDNSDYQKLIENIAEIRKINITDISDPLPIVYCFCETLSHGKAATLRPEFKIPMMKILAGYCHAMFFKLAVQKQRVDENDKEKLLSEIKKVESLISNDKEFGSIVKYYLFCAKSACFLLKDNHQIDWAKHSINIVQTAASYFTCGQGSKLGELGSDFAQFAKKEMQKFLTWRTYEQVLMIVNLQLGVVNSVDEFNEVCKDLRKRLAEQESWEITYTHMEVLETIYQKSQDEQIKRAAFQQICKYGKKANDSKMKKLLDKTWIIREKAIHFALRAMDQKSPLFNPAVAEDALTFLQQRKEAETHEPLKRLLENYRDVMVTFQFIDSAKTQAEMKVIQLLTGLQLFYKEKFGKILLRPSEDDDEERTIPMITETPKVKVAVKNINEKDKLIKTESLFEDAKEWDLDQIFDHPIIKQQEQKKIIIYGEEGDGKTTLSRYICYHWASESKGLWNRLFDLVVLIQAPELNVKRYPQKESYEAKEIIVQECFIKSKKEAPILFPLFKDEAFRAKTLIIFDGYDMLTEPCEREGHLNQAFTELLKFPNVIVTSRPKVVKGFPGARALLLNKLTPA
eukprot:TRINITY_DN6590_c0_g1_i2.p1 TRINITY_DN6590_c0_g1~~TRINITY_DN6590_c0_g1_i2.p1  ORF type:complete len:614 (-),score=123.57 TRINITY_DN6590_c0_g1_i2:103-1944(-)